MNPQDLLGILQAIDWTLLHVRILMNSFWRNAICGGNKINWIMMMMMIDDVNMMVTLLFNDLASASVTTMMMMVVMMEMKLFG